MSDGEFYGYIGLLTLSGALLAIMAARGFGQARSARIADAIFAAGFLGYAGYLAIANPATVTIFFYAFAVPILAVVNAVRSRRRAPVPAPFPYADPSASHPAGGFPPAPVFPAAGPAAFSTPPGSASPAAPDFQSAAALFAAPKPPAAPQPTAPEPGTYRTMPSGLAGHESHEQSLPSGRPSGLPTPVTETYPMAPAAPGTSPSGLPRRTPTYTEPQPAATGPAFAPPAQTIPQRAPLASAEPAFAPPAHAAPQTSAQPSSATPAHGAPPQSPGGPAPAHVGPQPASEAAYPRHAEPAQGHNQWAPESPTNGHGEQPAHVEFTQRLIYTEPIPVRDEPAGPQPIYPAYPASPAAPAHHWQSDLTEQFPLTREQRLPAHRSEQAPAGYQNGPDTEAAWDEYEQGGRHGYKEQNDWQDQPSYRPAHGQPAEEGHPADWPPFPR
jgi:hypothetical protein